MSRTHQLYHALQRSRVACTALRLEAFRLRKDRDALKTQLEAAQREIELLKTTGSVDVEFNAVEVICMDARQYEALSVKNAGGKL